MAARDIRRETSDVSPNNFINPGVKDDSLGQLISGVGGAAVELDKGLAIERFGEATETLRSQYMVNDPATRAAQEEIEAEDEMEEIPSVSIGEDKHALKDFASVLDKNKLARDQGVMSNDAFRIRAERLYRIAITNRPGLAAEFRQQASGILGFDVVGSAIDIRKETEAAMDAAKGKTAKDAAELQDYNNKQRYEQLKAAGFPVDLLNMPVGSPEFDKYYTENFDALQQRTQAKVQLDMANQAVAMHTAGNTLNESTNTMQWLAQANAVNSGISVGIETIQANLKKRGLEQDPSAVRAAITEAQGRLDQEMATLEAAAAGGRVPDDVKSRQMTRLQATRDRVASVLSMEDDKEFLTNATAVLTGSKKLSLYNDDEFNTTTALLDALGPSAPLLASKMEKSLVLLAGRMATDKADTDVVAKNVGSMIAPLIGSVFPRGVSTPPDPGAVDKLAQLLDKGAQSFYLVDDASFRLEAFTGSTSKPGFLQSLNMQLKTLDTGLTEDQKLDLGMSIAAATANAVRVAGAGLQQEVPSIKGKFEYDFTPEGGQVFKPKAGVTLTQPEQLKLAKYNRAFNTPLIENVVGTLTGEDRAGVWQTVASSYRPVQQARQKAATARPAPERTQGSGSNGNASTGLRGPSTRWWDQ